jgi:16S rRNA (cytosine967-C5)-methyltransferase
MAKSRAVAAHILYAVLYEGQSLTSAFDMPKMQQLPAQHKPMVKEIGFGCMRWYQHLKVIANSVMQKPLKKKEALAECLLLVGIYQLRFMNVAPHAAISETVTATKIIKKPWAKGLINACLRQVQRQIESKELPTYDNDQALYSHPQWFIEQVKKAYPNDWQRILEQNNLKPPFSLRVNLNQQTREDYCSRLEASPTLITHTETGVIFEGVTKIDQLPGFEAGDISVQDGAAQMAALLLDPQPNERILDACAAPGGKTCHIYERQPKLASLVALEIDANRVSRIQENLERIGGSAEVKVADACDLEQWWDGKAFDRILLDVPCSATGIIRRHPDIKWLRKPNDIKALHDLQQEILIQAWKTLKPGGRLLYATCSILPQENADNVAAFLAQNSDAEVIPIEQATNTSSLGWQILPGDDYMDGFYYCLLQKLD